jgi:hypothetical protein
MSSISRISRCYTLLALAFLASSFLASAARADVILFTDIGQAQGAPWGGTQVGVAITVANSVLNISSVQMVQTAGDTSGESISVYTQNPADGKIGALYFGDFSMSHDDGTGLETATANSPLLLQPNTSYWFAMNSNSNFDVTLNAASNGNFTPTPYASFATPFAVTITSSDTGGVPEYGSASVGPPYLQLLGTAVPEPSSLAAMAALGLCASLTRRRNSGQK